MSESWRNILERAADNLSIDLDQMTAPAFRPAHAAVGSRRLSPQLSFAESRELLARELRAFSSHSKRSESAQPKVARSTALIVPVTAPARKARPASVSRKPTPWRNVMAAFLSAILTGSFTAYVLMAQGQFGREDVLAVAAYAGQAFAVAGEAHAHAAPTQPAAATPVVNRSTEDALMERASYQMSQGDGEGARAVYEVLARHGSPRGAFALAETYDPAALAKRPELRLKSNMRLAREWYKKASELGSFAAYERFKALDKRAASLPQNGAQL